jgi:hypothetical protein
MKQPAPNITGKIPGRKSFADRARELLQSSAVRRKKIRLRLKAPRFMAVIDDKKNNTSQKRLSRFLDMVHADEFTKALSETPERPLEDMKREQPDKGWCESNFELSNHEVFYHYAGDALTLDSKSGVDDPIFQAFEEAKLNPVDPLHWRVLMTVLCWTLFPPKESAGHPTFWTDKRYCQLLKEIHKLKHGRQRKRSDKEACLLLSKKRISGDPESRHIFENDDGPLTDEALRRALQQARDPEHNGILADFVNGVSSLIREDYERRKDIWPPVDLEGALARLHEFESEKSRAADTEDAKSRFVGSENGMKDRVALLQTLRDRRERYHEGLSKALSAAGVKAFDFSKVLEDRRASVEGNVYDALANVTDYDDFLKVLESVVKADQDVLLHTIVDECQGADLVAFIDALHDEFAYEPISQALAEYCCEQISTGQISRESRSLDH